MNEFYNRLQIALTERIEQRSPPITSGSCEDFAEYKFLTGCLAGLDEAMKIAAEVAKKMTEPDTGENRYAFLED